MGYSIENIKKKKLVFTITTGRSGTKYLAQKMSLIRNTKSEHEGKPAFHDYFRSIQNGKYTYEKFWIEHKLPYIANLNERVYFDASHIACKGFFESLINLGIKPSIIILKRDNRQVAQSLLSLRTIPSRTEIGNIYLNSPLDDDVLKIDSDIADLTDYQLCFWYTLEIDRRIDYYKNIFNEQKITFVEVDFNQLINGDGFSKIKRDLKLPKLTFRGYLYDIFKKNFILNEKTHSKTQIENLNFESEENELLKLINE